MAMLVEYDIDELERVIVSCLSDEGYRVSHYEDLGKELNWSPPLTARKGHITDVIDTRISNDITDFWLQRYSEIHKHLDGVRVFVAIPKTIGPSYELGKRLERANVGIILVSDDDITYLFEPRGEALTRKEFDRITDPYSQLLSEVDASIYGPYSKDITEAITVLRLGQPRNAIAIIGRTLETAVDDYLVKANKEHHISLSTAKRKSMNFDSKIRWMASGNGRAGRKKSEVITRSVESKMLSVKWDRNIGDHPAPEAEIVQLAKDSRAVFELGLSMIRLMKEKREAL